MPKRMAEYTRRGEYRQYGVHYFGAILPIVSILGIYRAMILGFLEVQVDPDLGQGPILTSTPRSMRNQGPEPLKGAQRAHDFACFFGPGSRNSTQDPGSD